MKSLYGKFLSFTVGIMFTSGLIAYLCVNTYYHQVLKEKNDWKNMNIALSIVSFIQQNESMDLNTYFSTQAATGYKLIVVDAGREAKMYGEPFRKENLSSAAIEQVLKGEIYHGMRDLHSETFVTGFFSNESANTVGVPLMHQDERYALFLRPDIKMLFTEVHHLLGGMVIVMGIVSVLSMLVVAKKLIEPITVLTVATKKVGEEQYSETLQIKRKDEIGQLAQSFQRMTEKLRENDRIRKEFISDVSHDFQTPLLNIKGYSALLLKEDLKDNERKSYAAVIQSETERMSLLTKQLLLLTSLDQLTSPMVMKTFDLSMQLKETARKVRWLLEEKELSLSMEMADIHYTGDPAFLEKVWENLLSNAIKYTQFGGSIDLSLTEQADSVKIIFNDNGIGMDEVTKAQLFDRFYRADQSRTKETGGTGLGLSIVQQVVHLHQGTIEVHSELGKGTCFTVFLPKL